MAKPWTRERTQNEADALKLIRNYTTILVPTPLDVSEGPDGYYVTTEFVAGFPLNNIGNTCRMPSLDGHPATACTACLATANYNATIFITEVVLPQLSRLKSYETGFNGIVIPPPWVTENDRGRTWAAKKSEKHEFVFCHGDLAAHNIMCDPLTLEVVCVFDWENAGYYPPEFLQLWSISKRPSHHAMYYYSLLQDEKRLDRLIRSLEP